MAMKSLTKRLEAGGQLGAWCTFASFDCAEMMTGLGFDFLVLDMQHGEITAAQMPGLFGAFRDETTLPVVRAPQNDYHAINWLFDQGAAGVLVPMVNSVADAKRAAEASKYPPLGKRSFGPHRAARYSFGVAEYMPAADELSTLIVQIEHVDAARDIQSILKVPGVDAVFMGPNDLAYSMLKPGQNLFAAKPGAAAADGASQWTAFARSPEVMDLCADVMRSCNEAGMPFGMTAGSFVEARDWLANGAKFVTYGSDFLFLRAGAKHTCDMPSGS